MKILESILNDKTHRKQLIKEFQDMIWNNEESGNFFSELAYDFDFYQPDENLRKEDVSYYGDERRLEEIIKITLKKLNE